MKSIFWKMFLSYIAVLILPILIMGILSYLWVSDIVEEQTRQYYKTTVREVKASVDNRFKDINNFVIQMSQTPWVTRISNMRGDSIDYSRVDPIEMNDHVNELMGYSAINHFFDMIVITFPEKNYTISSIGIVDNKTFFNEVAIFDNLSYSDWKKYLLKYNAAPVILRSGQLKTYSSNTSVVPYIQTLPTKDQRVRAVMLTFINHEKLQSILKVLQASEDSSLYIADGDGELVAGINTKDEIIRTWKQNKSETLDEELKQLEINGQRLFFFSLKSEVTDWTYNIVVPVSTVLNKVENIKAITIVLAIVLTLIGFIFSYIMTKNNYSPLNNLVNLVKGHSVDRTGRSRVNEYVYLENAVKSLLSSEDMLLKKSEQQIPLIRNIYLLRLLEDYSYVDKEFFEFMESIGVSFEYGNFQVALFEFSVPYGIGEEMQEQFIKDFDSPGYKIFPVEITGKRKGVIINSRSRADIELIRKLKAAMEEIAGNKCTAGLSGVVDRLGRLSSCYKEAQKALDYRLLMDKSDILFFDEIEVDNKTYYFYPTEQETRMLNELRVGKHEAAMAVVDEIIKANLSYSKLNITAARCLFYALMGTALKALNNLELEGLFDVSQEQIDKLESISDMRGYLNSIYKEICRLIQQNKKSHNQLLKESIEVFMEENYMLSDLSLELVADKMEISASYLSKFFKEQFGENFLDYVHKKRISTAKTLLNGQFTINQITEMVGYSSYETFRRVFKKNEGVTPGEYKSNN